MRGRRAREAGSAYGSGRWLSHRASVTPHPRQPQRRLPWSGRPGRVSRARGSPIRRTTGQCSNATSGWAMGNGRATGRRLLQPRPRARTPLRPSALARSRGDVSVSRPPRARRRRGANWLRPIRKHAQWQTPLLQVDPLRPPLLLASQRRGDTASARRHEDPPRHLAAAHGGVSGSGDKALVGSRHDGETASRLPRVSASFVHPASRQRGIFPGSRPRQGPLLADGCNRLNYRRCCL